MNLKNDAKTHCDFYFKNIDNALHCEINSVGWSGQDNYSQRAIFKTKASFEATIPNPL